jgi:hypothetical protein
MINKEITINPPFKTFRQRISILLILSLLLFICINIYGMYKMFSPSYLLKIDIIFIPFGLVTVLDLITSVFYLKSITINKTEVTFILCRFNSIYKTYSVNIQDLKVEIKRAYLDEGKWNKKYKLVVKSRKHGMHDDWENICSQHEIGGWNVDLFNTFLSEYNERK